MWSIKNKVIPHMKGIPRADGYVNLCQSGGKAWSNYIKSDSAQEYVEGLVTSLRIGRDVLIDTVTTGANENRGTWVHPEIAIDLAKWVSVEYEIQVNAGNVDGYLCCHHLQGSVIGLSA